VPSAPVGLAAKAAVLNHCAATWARLLSLSEVTVKGRPLARLTIGESVQPFSSPRSTAFLPV
jgi:hypothetical protein